VEVRRNPDALHWCPETISWGWHCSQNSRTRIIPTVQTSSMSTVAPSCFMSPIWIERLGVSETCTSCWYRVVKSSTPYCLEDSLTINRWLVFYSWKWAPLYSTTQVNLSVQLRKTCCRPSKVTWSKIECTCCKHGIRFVTKTEPALVASHYVREFIPFINSELFQRQICFEDLFSSIGFTHIMRYLSSHELLHSEISHQNSFDCLVGRRKSYCENPSRKKWFVAQ
jgi:hypothetical protein